MYFILSVNNSDHDYYLSPNTNTSVIITNPGYPYGYAPNLNLTWTIHSEPHYHIDVEFLEVNLNPISSSSETFNNDHITVETGIIYRIYTQIALKQINKKM